MNIVLENFPMIGTSTPLLNLTFGMGIDIVVKYQRKIFVLELFWLSGRKLGKPSCNSPCYIAHRVPLLASPNIEATLIAHGPLYWVSAQFVGAARRLKFINRICHVMRTNCPIYSHLERAGASCSAVNWSRTPEPGPARVRKPGSSIVHVMRYGSVSSIFFQLMPREKPKYSLE